jgi:antibiotic biosynthesis monooxygenase (ABM) superfamily enzyme
MTPERVRPDRGAQYLSVKAREIAMFLTMNRFRVKPGSEEAFETLWKSRDSHLERVPGFVAFHLMKGAAGEGFRL